MKRIVFIIIMFCICLLIISYKVKNVSIEKINFNLYENEILFTFLSSSDNKAILIMDKDKNNLLVLDLKNSKDFNNDLSKFVSNKLDNVFIKNNIKIDINIKYTMKDYIRNYVNFSNYSIVGNNNIVSINNNKYNFCIVESGINKDISNCDFIYFISLDKEFNVNDNIKAVFYSKDIKNLFKESNYTKWVDNYEIEENCYYALKITDDDYEVITIPK